jgi:nicotinamide mononucleotide adenylyltransferase
LRCKNEELTIAVGSSQEQGTKDNPLSFQKRKELIEEVLNARNLSARIVAVPDIGDNERWVAHVLSCTGPTDAVLTGNHLVKELFEKAGIKVLDVILRPNVSATRVRELIKKGDDEWKNLVPQELRSKLGEWTRSGMLVSN